jgi:hypothetical protein
MFGSGFLREPDYRKAIRIVREELSRDPSADVSLSPTLWYLEYLRDKPSSRLATMMADIERFLDAIRMIQQLST